MALQVKGTITHILPAESGETKSGSAWIKQQFVITYGDEFERNVAFTLFGENKVNMLFDKQIGDEVLVSFTIQSAPGRSENISNKWFSEINAYRVEATGVSYAQPNRPAYPQGQPPITPRVQAQQAPAPAPAPAPAAAAAAPAAQPAVKQTVRQTVKQAQPDPFAPEPDDLPFL